MKTEIFKNNQGGLFVREYVGQYPTSGWHTYPISHTYDNQYWRKLAPDEVVKRGDRFEERGRYYSANELAGGVARSAYAIFYRSCGKVPRRRKKKRRDPHTVKITFRCTPEFASDLTVNKTCPYTPSVYADSMTRLGNAAAQALENCKKAAAKEKKMNQLRQLQRKRDKVLAELEELRS